MKKVIWKYTITVSGSSQVIMPKGAKILSVGEQHGSIRLWALLDEEPEAFEVREFLVVPTGSPQNYELDPEKFLGTVSLQGGLLIYHVFEV